MKIYTKTGDAGQTALFAGGRVSKAHNRIEAVGAIDELSAAIGLARTADPSAEAKGWLEEVQTQLFHLGADLATPLDAKADWIVRVDAAQTRWLEDTMESRGARVGIGRPVATADRGCPFFARCPVAIEGTCDRETPPVRRLGGRHTIECHRSEAEFLEGTPADESKWGGRRSAERFVPANRRSEPTL